MVYIVFTDMTYTYGLTLFSSLRQQQVYANKIKREKKRQFKKKFSRKNLSLTLITLLLLTGRVARANRPQQSGGRCSFAGLSAGTGRGWIGAARGCCPHSPCCLAWRLQHRCSGVAALVLLACSILRHRVLPPCPVHPHSCSCAGLFSALVAALVVLVPFGPVVPRCRLSAHRPLFLLLLSPLAPSLFSLGSSSVRFLYRLRSWLLVSSPPFWLFPLVCPFFASCCHHLVLILNPSPSSSASSSSSSSLPLPLPRHPLGLCHVDWRGPLGGATPMAALVQQTLSCVMNSRIYKKYIYNYASRKVSGWTRRSGFSSSPAPVQPRVFLVNGLEGGDEGRGSLPILFLLLLLPVLFSLLTHSCVASSPTSSVFSFLLA